MVKPQPVYQIDRETSTQCAQDLQSYLTKRVAKTTLEEYGLCVLPGVQGVGAESFVPRGPGTRGWSVLRSLDG